MANVGGLLGTAGGFKGTGVSGPDTDITNQSQIDAAYQNVQNNLANQNALLAALRAQNGIQNQSNVYQQLQGIAAGTGPNPAQTMLAKATGANAAQQAAAAAGQRGSSKNVGMIARQAAQAGGAANQTAAADAATLQANQSLNAINAAGNIAGTQVANEIGQTNTNTQATQAEQSNLMNAMLGTNATNAGLITATAAQQASFGGGLSGGMASVAGSVGGKAAGGSGGGGAEGGQIKDGQFIRKMADGGPAQDNTTPNSSAYPGRSKFGAFLTGFAGQTPQDGMSQIGQFAGQQLGKAIGTLITNKSNSNAASQDDLSNSIGNEPPVASDADNSGPDMAKGGRVPAMVSPGEQYLPPAAVAQVKKGANPLAVGERIPGKPKHPGNDYRNDIVPKTLKEGGIVIPNKVMQSKNPHWEAMKFVRAYMAKGGQISVGLASKPRRKK